MTGGLVRGGPPDGFTLIELVIVMALLATFMAVVAPRLSGSLRQRNIDGEAARLVALTEYSRDEAASLGIPVVVWVDPVSRRFGVDAKTGYPADNLRRKEYALTPDVNFDNVNNAAGQGGRGINAAEFEPDGTLAPSSLNTVRLVDRFKSSVSVVQTADHDGYEIVKETR